MEQEYVVRVPRWPVYVVGGATLIIAILYAFLQTVQMQGSGGGSGLVMISRLAQDAHIAVMVWIIIRMARALRHPARVNGQGMRLWSSVLDQPVTVPWTEVSAVSRLRRWPTSLHVYVRDPEVFVPGGTLPRNGTLFEIPRFRSARRRGEFEAAVQRFSGGAVVVHDL